jgi:hypothetical protein
MSLNHIVYHVTSTRLTQDNEMIDSTGSMELLLVEKGSLFKQLNNGLAFVQYKYCPLEKDRVKTSLQNYE